RSSRCRATWAPTASATRDEKAGRADGPGGGGHDMAVIADVGRRGVSPDEDDTVRKEGGWLERVPGGGIAHLTWWEDADDHNLDAWESEEAFGRFGEERLGPAMAKVGVAAQPEVTFHPAHEVFLPKAVTLIAT